MLTKKELTTVYNHDYFTEGYSVCVINEKSKKTGGNTGLESVTLNNCGKYLTISPRCKERATLYLPKFRNIQYRKDVDCTILMEKEGQHYLFLIELKSGVGGVFEDAIYKYPGVYFLTKSRLNDFAGHDSELYEEVALIIYAPNAPKGITTKDRNTKMLTQKRNIIKTPEDKIKFDIEKKYKALLKDKTLAYLDGADFGVDELPLCDTYKMNHLKTILWPVDYPNGSVDLDEIIKLL